MKLKLNTYGRRWRFNRNCAIVVLSRAGWSQRLIADVFDLPRSRVASILREMDELSREWIPSGPSMPVVHRITRMARKPLGPSLYDSGG